VSLNTETRKTWRNYHEREESKSWRSA